MARDPGGKQIEVVHRLLRDYGERGIFRGVSEGVRRQGRITYTVRWHYDRAFRLTLAPRRGTVLFPELLPNVAPHSPMARALRSFLHRFETADAPEHRRVDGKKASLRVAVRKGHVVLGVTALDGDLEYATRKLVHLAHEVFMVFLPDGPYDDYRVATLGMDPNLAWI